MKDTMGTADFGNQIRVGPDDVTYKKSQALAQGVPVHVNPVVMKDAMGDATLGFKVLVGPDEVALHKKDQK